MSHKDIHILFVTVGEPFAFETLDALIEYMPVKHKLCIWYDTCGREVDWPYFQKLRTYTDNVILSTQNQATARILGYAMLYLDGDYLMYVPCDNLANPDYYARLMAAIDNTENAGCVGCARVDDNPDFKFEFDFIANSRVYRPDGIMIYPKKTIKDVGGICPSFGEHGFMILEWLERAMSKGWNLVSCSKVAKEIGGMHYGREMNPKTKEEIEYSTKTYLKIKDSGYKNFIWWDDSYKEKKGDVVLCQN